MGWRRAENAQALATGFQAYLEANRDEIEALTIFYSQPARRREVTYAMIKAGLDKLKKTGRGLPRCASGGPMPSSTSTRATDPASELTALVALIRRACGIDKTVSPYSETVRRNFQDWIMKRHSGAGQKFNEEQMDWLHMIRDHIIASFHIERDDLDMAPFDAKGGLGRCTSFSATRWTA